MLLSEFCFLVLFPVLLKVYFVRRALHSFLCGPRSAFLRLVFYFFSSFLLFNSFLLSQHALATDTVSVATLLHALLFLYIFCCFSSPFPLSTSLHSPTSQPHWLATLLQIQLCFLSHFASLSPTCMHHATHHK